MTYQECYALLSDCQFEEQINSITKEWCETQVVLSEINHGRGIPARTWTALINHGLIIDNCDGTFSLGKEKTKVKQTKTSKNIKSSFSISKSDNQYYAQYIEEAVVALINGEAIPNHITNIQFTDSEIQKMNEDAAAIAANYPNSTAFYKGRQTGSESCDMLIDGKEVELKYCQSSSSGTYYNTSVTYFDRYGLKSFKDFLTEYGVLAYLEKFFGKKVYNDISPVSQAESSTWRHNNPTEYAELKKIEAIAREAYVKYIFEFFQNNSDKIQLLAQDMLTKQTSNKHAPDLIIIYHYNCNEIIKITKDEILSMVNSNKFSRTGGTIKFDKFHITIAWQNGTGLNNPTIRVFID